MRSFRPGALACLVAVLGACGGGASSPAASTDRSPTTASPTTAGAPVTTRADEGDAGGIDPLAGASTDDVVVEATNRETALLTAVRAARHEGYDRVVFEFANVLPGYRVGYIDRPVVADGSGQEVDVAGAQVVGLRFENALDADLSKESAPRTYTGPRRISPSTPQVVEIVLTGGFEGVLNWAVGLRDRVDLRVTTLNSPPRVVVDFANH